MMRRLLSFVLSSAVFTATMSVTAFASKQASQADSAKQSANYIDSRFRNLSVEERDALRQIPENERVDIRNLPNLSAFCRNMPDSYKRQIDQTRQNIVYSINSFANVFSGIMSDNIAEQPEHLLDAYMDIAKAVAVRNGFTIPPMLDSFKNLTLEQKRSFFRTICYLGATVKTDGTITPSTQK